MMNPCHNAYSEFWVFFFVDRLLKAAAWRYWSHPVHLLPFLSLEAHYNTGVSWSLFAHSGYWGSLVLKCAIGGLLFALAWYTYQRRQQGYCTLGEVLILVGGSSNFLDRIRYGGVIDYIHVHIGAWSFPIFNVADVLIVLGISYMIFRPYHED